MHHTIDLHSGAALTLLMFEPAAAPLAAVVVPSAMGVTQGFSARFAEWLAARGYLGEKITCAMSPSRTSASEMAQGDGQPPSSAS
jgi:predicted alpha/beta hydrolase